jgi:VWFA-related protein
MSRRFITSLGFLVVSLASAALAQPTQTAATDQSSTPVIQSTSQEVVLDLVFRDQHGQTIRNIRPEEVHITEDGVEQKVTSFREVDISSPAQPNAPLDPLREVRLVTFVFEGLDLDGKRFFRQALKEALDLAPEQNLYFSIMAIDQRLHLLQPFTADHAALLKAADESAKWSFVQYSKQSEELKAQLKQTIDQGSAQLQGGAAGGPSQSQVQSGVALKMAQIQYDMLQSSQAADTQFNARNTIDALLNLVRAESQLPGRKVVLYFNPVLFIPEQIKEQYLSLISAANRANVSFYTVDPKGLVTWSQNGAGRDFLGSSTSATRNSQLSGGVGEVTPGQVYAAENAETSLRANPLLWLRDLARQTGGATIAETNDTRAPLRTALDETRMYYEATYNPHITSYDGKFRRIAVRVDRQGVVAHTRSGYFALPPVKGGQQLYGYEIPLLTAIDSEQPASDVAFQAAAERFNNHGANIEYMLTLEAPLKGMDFVPQPDHKTDAVDAALLAIVKDSQGQIVQKFSKDFAVQVDASKVDAYKAGNLVQTYRAELPPGRYTLEAAVMDRKTNKIGVKKSAFSVPEPSPGLSISDVVMVRSTEKVSNGQMADAFYLPGGKIVPTLTNTVKGGPGNVVPLYFSIYPDRSKKESPRMTISFYKGGQFLGSAEAPPLPAAQNDGRIPYNLNLPADKFTPGSWEIEFNVTQGDSKAQQKLAFQVQ